MESITDLTPEIQKRISDFEQFLSKEGMKRPEVKFTGAILTAMLKRHHVHVSVLARSLEEKITPKKTWERLNRNLSKEGLGRVRDGSKKAQDKKPVIGNGYYWLNAVMANDKKILPVYEDIYSLEREAKDHMSVHTKINEITDMVHEINPDTIFVIDRGGDGETVLEPMIKEEKKFVVRGQSTRSLRLHKDSTKAINIKEITQRAKTPFSYKSSRNGKNFMVGIRRVYLGDTPLWLVVSRRQQ